MRNAARSRHTVPTIVVLLVVSAVVADLLLSLRRDDGRRQYLSFSGWPANGSAAVQIGDGPLQASPDDAPVPIASVAKVMTAYLVLKAEPLTGDESGPVLQVTQADVEDTERRRNDDQSIVAVSNGERLTERQALTALLLPSANNVAVMLARQIDGSVDAFVDRMNRAAAALGMRHTTYTDPSGLDEQTQSTAHDQVLLADAAMRYPAFAAIVAQRSAHLPVAGTVRNTDRLLGVEGFVGTKTGSDSAAGGCFVFRTWRVVDGTVTAITGVVLGQPGHDLITAALTAARQLAHRVAPQTPNPTRGEP